jgi:hypothetical protein
MAPTEGGAISSFLLNRRNLVFLLIGGFLVFVALIPVNTGAIVPPTDCGILKVNGKRFNIKADQIRCRRARRYSKAYLISHWRPSGYHCRRYRHSALRFRCAKGIRVYYAIRR